MAEGSLITEELRKLIGVSGEPITYKVEEGAIQRYAEAIGDLNPLYHDVEYASKSKHGRLICPPGFTGWPIKGQIGALPGGASEMMGAFAKAGAPSRLLDGGIEFEFFIPIGAGDVLIATSKVADMTERETSMGKTMFITTETTFEKQNGDAALRSRATMICF
ncbi:MAG: MaoC family dehydratase N-terminal domain-containing protein [Dehalococcoidia bacterium]|nr:MaoC family dehydratase N-terminal domain-containing protein [Dehalococcoidia bacterium]